MAYQMTVSPDFSPSYIAGWFIFNTWLQKQIDEAIHLELYDSFAAQRKSIVDGKVDLIFANPYDAAMLIRKKGFVAVSAPVNRPDEVVVCVHADSNVERVEDLSENCSVAMTHAPEINNLGMIMLEPADLTANNVNISHYENYVLVAKSLMTKQADVGFFLEETYANMSKIIRSQTKPIVTSQISVIKHIFLVGPSLAQYVEEIRSLLNDMHNNVKGLSVLESLSFAKLENQTKEDSEFMIDLIDTLI